MVATAFALTIQDKTKLLFLEDKIFSKEMKEGEREGRKRE